MRILSAILCAAALWLGAARLAHADVTVQALGSAPSGGGDAEKTRRRALDDAFRQAVDQVAASLLAPEAQKQHAETIKTRVLRRARAYVTSHRVLDERDEGGVYQISVEAVVADATLRKDLRALGIPMIGDPVGPPGGGAPPPPVASRPKLVVVAVGAGDTGALAELVARALQGRGWDVAAAVRNEVPIDDLRAVEAARGAGAKVTVVVTVEARDGGAVRGTSLRGAELDVLARVVDGSGAEPSRLVEQRLSVAGAGIGDDGALVAAFHEAAARTARAVGPRLEERWPATPVAAGGITVWTRGVARWSEPAAVARALAAVPGVERVVVAGVSRGEVRFAVVGRAAEGALAAAVSPSLGQATVAGAGLVRVDLAPPAAPVAPAGPVVTP